MRARGFRNGVVIGVAVLAMGVAAAWRFGVLPGGGGDEPPGEPVADVSVQLLDGQVVSMSQLRGRVVLVNFWATWCPPCRLEMPGFQKVWEARRDDGFMIVGLSADRLPPDQVAWFLEQRGFDYPVGMATRYASESFGYGGTLPHSFLVDAEGRVRREVTGAYEQAQLVRDVDALLREAGREPTGAVEAVRHASPKWLELEEAGHAMGSAEAPITVLEFSDYGCGYCRQFSLETFPSLRDEFIEPGEVRWLHVPFVLGKFPHSEEAAMAGLCAGEQGESVYRGVHERLFERQAEWRAAADAEAVFARYAREAGGDGEALAGCVGSEWARGRLDRAEAVATASGVAATPTFFVNGQRVAGAIPLADFRAGLRSMLGR